MGWDDVSERQPPMRLLFVPQVIYENGGMMEWYWQGKTEELGETPVPVPLCPPQIPLGLTRAQTRASAMRGQRLTAWAMARPLCMVTYQVPDDEGYKYLRNVGSHLSLQDYV
jgi:hypothetical protein